MSTTPPLEPPPADPAALAYWPHPTVGRVDITPSADRQSAVATWRGDPQVERPTDGWLTAHATNAWGGLWAVVRWMDETASDDLEKRGEAHLRRVRAVTPTRHAGDDGEDDTPLTCDFCGRPYESTREHRLGLCSPGSDLAARRLAALGPIRTVTPGEHAPSPDERIRLDRPVQNDVNELRSVQNAEKIVLFAGCDPGAKGACAVLAVLDAPDTDAHGRILAVEVFDLPTTTRDDGGADLDVGQMAQRFMTSITRLTATSPIGITACHVVGRYHAVVERPQVTGGQRFGKVSLATQAINVGAAWATMHSVVDGMVSGGVKAGSVTWASSSATGGWRGELGGVAKGDEAGAVMAMRPDLADPHGGVAAFTSAVAADGQVLNDARPDRLVAVLLAEVARRRWLGTAVPQGARKSKDKAAKSRKKDARKAAVERAVAPLTVAKARTEALASSECPDPAHRVHQANAPHVPRGWCTRTMRCCEARLLDWAWRQRPWRPRPDQPEAALPGLKASPIVDLMHVAAIYRKTVKSKAWTVAKGLVHSFETSKMDDATFDALESNGLLQLIPGVKSVRYRPTERGLEWARRLRGGTGETVVDMAEGTGG